MSKTRNYVIIAVTMMLFLTFLGINTGVSPMFELINFTTSNASGQIDNMSTGFATSKMYNFVFDPDVGILIIVVSIVIIGLIARGQTANLLTITFITGVLVLFVQTFISVMMLASNGTYPVWMTAIIFITFLPITVGLVVSLVEWFKGVDN